MTSRRDFLKATGGLVIAFALPAAAQNQLPGSLRNNRMLNAWLRIDPTWAPLKGNPRFERLIAGA